VAFDIPQLEGKDLRNIPLACAAEAVLDWAACPIGLFPRKAFGKLVVQNELVECSQYFRVALKGLMLRVQGVPESLTAIRGVANQVLR
jgi:hypothetical protein